MRSPKTKQVITIIVSKFPANTLSGSGCRMIGNFGGIYFAFFASQEPFTKIKTTKFLLPTSIWHYFKLFSRLDSINSLSTSVH